MLSWQSAKGAKATNSAQVLAGRGPGRGRVELGHGGQGLGSARGGGRRNQGRAGAGPGAWAWWAWPGAGLGRGGRNLGMAGGAWAQQGEGGRRGRGMVGGPWGGASVLWVGPGYGRCLGLREGSGSHAVGETPSKHQERHGGEGVWAPTPAVCAAGAGGPRRERSGLSQSRSRPSHHGPWPK